MNPQPEVLARFDTTITAPDGRQYAPRACAREMGDGRWEGWIDFVPVAEGDMLSSPRETVQPNHTDVAYWAAGLTRIYLEGALQRAWDVEVALPRVVEPEPPPRGPAVRPIEQEPPPPRAVLDPFQVYSQGEDVLRQQLHALDVAHLEQIVKAYDLPLPRAADGTNWRTALETAILTGVRDTAGA